jgi:SmpA/OmlA family protein
MMTNNAFNAAVIGTLLCASACSRVAPSVNCEALRQLNLGMNEAQVAKILGPPMEVSIRPSQVTFMPERDLTWAYHRGWFSGNIPSPIKVFVDFKDHKLVLASISRRFPVVGEDHTLFELSERGKRESEEFQRTYCR